MKIYTKTGDKGTTSLYGGKPSLKSGKIVDLIGTVDELNSILGVAISVSSPITQKTLLPIQSDLFVIGGYLAGDTTQKQKNDFKKKTISLEKQIDKISLKLSPLRFFILPGGSNSSANLHYARTVCRRFERLFVEFLNDTNWMDKESDLLAFINRLSDLLYILARYENHVQGVEDVVWRSNK